MRLRKSAFSALFSLVVLLSACGTNPPAASSAPVDTESQLEASSAQEPGPVLYVPDATEVVPWGITVSNESLGVSVSLTAPKADVIAALGNDYMLTSVGDSTITVYMKSDISFTSDTTGNLDYFSVGNGWSFNSQFSIGDSAEKLVALYGEPDERDGFGCEYYFEKDGSRIDLSDERFSKQLQLFREEARGDPAVKASFADVHASFKISDGVVTSISLAATNQIPPPILVADGICEIYTCSRTLPDSAGGVGASISFNNLSERPMKYITFYTTPYNGVNDAVTSSVGNKSTVPLQMTGPIDPPMLKGDIRSGSWETVWYNDTIRSCKIDSVTIEYMDGEILNLPVA